MQVQTWRENAACKGVRPSLFYPEDELEERKAKAICNLCRVKDRCLEFALASGESEGVWGGLNTRQRRRLARARRELKVYVGL
ncbi:MULTISPECIES: WhiB family transcriptional regulator [Acidithrix]|jgi:WhiB family redox-sensing transcriptional regulator|uniref:Transcriptional regulator WhiB n=1 Tax=Acidithrix ferrooxidans TaxID=1280514 RepID=A0A0D8HDV9_9ACTN|nr:MULTISPECIES: WhiB family transcriptional regulator [Acidithrix]KJF16118.1 transcriptional regulator WhiB2 [Acidithrix ferrooxidans]